MVLAPGSAPGTTRLSAVALTIRTDEVYEYRAGFEPAVSFRSEIKSLVPST